MRQLIVLMMAMCLCFPFICAQNSNFPIYLDMEKPIEEKIDDAMRRMTLEEKVALCHAQSKFSSPGVPRLGIPDIWMSDGPHGIREELLWDLWKPAAWTNDSCFAFPALTCLAATWNPELSLLYGCSVGEEARYRNKNVLLGPGVNIYRTPLNGRNFEYLGEDPYLTSMMVVPYIKGVQSNGVAACVKHFAVNNQETGRHKINVQVSDRALHEIYLPAFKAAVQKGGVWTLMGAYNKYKGEHCCHNRILLKDILKQDWKFDGVVVSDWGGTHDTREAILNGLDMEYGTWTDGLSWGESDSYSRYHLATPYLELLRSGQVSEEDLNDKVRRILRLIYRTSMGGHQNYGSFVSEAHMEAGRRIAEEGIVLLQNKGELLPLDLTAVKTIAVIGENAVRPLTCGGGSSALKVKYEVSPLEGIQNMVGSQVNVIYARGYASTEYAALRKQEQSADKLMLEAVEVARKADVVIFVGGLNKDEHQDCEGADRDNMELPYGQNELIKQLVAVNPHLVVTLVSGNAVAMPWIKDVPVVLESWFGGSEAGNALASILVGQVNPSGKLPFTFPVKLSDNAAHALNAFPGDEETVEYKEGIFVGYRWHDKEKIRPLFAFGHGLSYTRFKYSDIEISSGELSQNDCFIIKVRIKNVGQRSGKEIVQLYIHDERCSLPRPEKELKGFAKVDLAPDEEQTITFKVGKEELSFYDDHKGNWIVEPGVFEALVGASSDDIRLSAKFKLK